MRQEAVTRLLDRAGAPWSGVEKLLAEGLLLEVERAGHLFAVPQRRGPPGI